MPAERISSLLKEPRELDAHGPARGALRPGLAARDPLDRAAAARVASACARATAWSARPARSSGRPVYCYAQDQTFVGGSLGEAHAETIVRVMELAGRAGGAR